MGEDGERRERVAEGQQQKYRGQGAEEESGDGAEAAGVAAADDVHHFAREVVRAGMGRFEGADRAGTEARRGGECGARAGEAAVAIRPGPELEGREGEHQQDRRGDLPGEERTPGSGVDDEEDGRAPVVPAGYGAELGVDHRRRGDGDDRERSADPAEKRETRIGEDQRGAVDAHHGERGGRGPGLAREPA